MCQWCWKCEQSFNKTAEGKEFEQNAIYDPWASHFTKMWFRGLVTYKMTIEFIHSYDERLLRTLCTVYCAIKHRQHDSNQLPTPLNSYIMKPKKT